MTVNWEQYLWLITHIKGMKNKDSILLSIYILVDIFMGSVMSFYQ